MAYEIRDNSGSAFPNKKREKETHPHYTGTIKVTAPGEYWVSEWVKTDKNGQPWHSFSLKLKDATAPRSDAAPSGGNASPPKSPMDDVGDIPFAMCWEA